MNDTLDLASLVQESLNTANAYGTAATETIPAIVQQGNDIAAQRQKSANDAASAAQTKVSVEVGEIARQEATRKAIAARIGTDASKTGWIIGQQFEKVKAADAVMAAEMEQITQKRSVNFLSNPLGWFMAQATINDNIALYNQAEDTSNRAKALAAEAERMSQTSFQTNNALSSTTTEAYLAAMKVLSAQQHTQNALEAAMQGTRWNMEGILHATNASRDRLQVLYGANTAVNQERQYQMEVKRLNLATQSFNISKAAAAEKMSEDNFVLKQMANGYFNLTGRQMDGATAPQAMILFKSKHPDAVAWFESGLASSAIVGGQGSKPVISLSPAKAADLVGEGKVSNMSPAMNQVGEQLVTWRRAFENQAVQTQYPFDPKDKNSKDLAFNNYVKDQKKLALGNVAEGSVFAPFNVAKVASVNKNVANMPIWRNVLQPAVATGINVNDPNTIFGLVASAMQEGKLSYADALDLPEIYQAGLELNNQNRNFIAFGISPVRSYNASISIPGTMGKTTINFSDKNAFATALNKAEAINAQYNIKNAHKPLGIGAP